MTGKLLFALILGFGGMAILMLFARAVAWVFDGPTWRGFLFFSLAFSLIAFGVITNGR